MDNKNVLISAYPLYAHKNANQLVIEKLRKFTLDQETGNKLLGGSVIKYNQYYYIALDRKVLRIFAIKLKETWIKEKSAIQIKTKY